MANWFHLLGLFMVNVISHWGALVTGGAVTAGIVVYEKRKNKSLPWEVYAVVFSLFALYSFFAAWQDEHRNTEAVIAEKSAAVAAFNVCDQNSRVAEAYTRGLEGLIREQRERIDRQQSTNDAQQHDVSSCVVSLGKMNPKVREEIVVASIQFAAIDEKGKLVGAFASGKRYVFVVLITTNETEPRFHGYLSCDNVFIPTSSPTIEGGSQTVMSTYAAPAFVTEREYEISADVSGVEWSPARPAYLMVTSKQESLGKCRFQPI